MTTLRTRLIAVLGPRRARAFMREFGGTVLRVPRETAARRRAFREARNRALLALLQTPSSQRPHMTVSFAAAARVFGITKQQAINIAKRPLD